MGPEPLETSCPSTRHFVVQVAHFVPLVEIAHVHPRSLFGLLTPLELYGGQNPWSFCAGLRVRAGSTHNRMGRYGAALQTPDGPSLQAVAPDTTFDDVAVSSSSSGFELGASRSPHNQ